MSDEFEIVITRRRPNPKYQAKRLVYDHSEEPAYTETRVTTATLNEFEWAVVQHALLAAIGRKTETQGTVER